MHNETKVYVPGLGVLKATVPDGHSITLATYAYIAINKVPYKIKVECHDRMWFEKKGFLHAWQVRWAADEQWGIDVRSISGKRQDHKSYNGRNLTESAERKVRNTVVDFLGWWPHSDSGVELLERADHLARATEINSVKQRIGALQDDLHKQMERLAALQGKHVSDLISLHLSLTTGQDITLGGDDE